MKKFLLTLLTVVLIAGALGAAGFAGYRIGFSRGARISASSAPQQPLRRLMPFGQERMPEFRQFERGFGPGFPRNRFQMGPRFGFGFFGPLMFLGRIAIWGLILWFIFWLFTKSGWQLTRLNQPANTAKESPATPESPKTEE